MREFPFRIGRESRLDVHPWKMSGDERRSGLALPNNDLYLDQLGKGHFISREHLQIEQGEGNAFLVVDRGSICGTTVGDTFVGGMGKGGMCRMQDGDTLIIGPAHSHIRFRFEMKPAHRHKSAAHRRYQRMAGSTLWLAVLAVVTVIATVAVHGFML